MKTLLMTCLLIMTCIFGMAQDNPNKLSAPIVAEGKILYQSEMASWYGTDIFLEKYSNHDTIGGYVSYTENGVSKCVFFSKGVQPVVLGTMQFDSTYKVETALTSLEQRTLTNTENELRLLRQKAQSIINNDTFFLNYNNASLNIIPLISGKEKKVYVLTGPKINGVVLFGNDYLLQFDTDNNLLSKKRLHNNLIPVNYTAAPDSNQTGTMHTHLGETGDFITATDICTLMLYARFTNWQQHIVISEKYVSIWDCNKNSLFALTRKAWDKIYADQEKRQKKE